jgi:hypothetical protein
MFAIRKKDNHNQFLAWGYTETGGLGEFDSTIFEEVELDSLPENYEMYKEKPLAMGKDLIKFLNDFNSGMNAEDIKNLLKKLVVTYILLENRPFNPFTEESFAFVLSDLDSTLNGDAQLVKQICLGWAKDKRFAEKK